jgi:hypothetical protein
MGTLTVVNHDAAASNIDPSGATINTMSIEEQADKEREIMEELRHEKQCRALLNWCGDGEVKIQVIDGERFNEEIFLGEVPSSYYLFCAE